jgi:hypothetical protein
LGFDVGVSLQTDEQVHVVGHDDEIAQPVSLAIEVSQTVGDVLSEVGPPQDARSMPTIEVFLVLTRERVVKLRLLRFR